MPQTNDSLLRDAIHARQADRVRALLAEGADLSITDEEGKTPLMLAASVGAPEIVEALLAAGADPTAKDRRGSTARHLASWHGEYRMGAYTPESLRIVEMLKAATLRRAAGRLAEHGSPDSGVELFIIFTDSAVLISRKPHASWRQIQDEIEDYKASLGPMSPDDAVAWLGEEYSDLSPDASAQVRAFMGSSEEIVEITFAVRPRGRVADAKGRRAELVVALWKSRRALPWQVAIAACLLGVIAALRLWLDVPWWLTVLAALAASAGAIGDAINVLYCRRALRLLHHQPPRP